MRIPHLKLHSLTVQMVITLVGLVCLTAAAIGIPAVLFIRAQSERYALQTLEQASRTVQALISERRSQLDSLALLTAQRPTLLRLISEGDPGELSAYLQELQLGAGLDLLLVCDPEGKPMLDEAAAVAARACGLSGEASALILPENGSPEEAPSGTPEGALQGWLFAVQTLPDEAGGGSVVTGQALDARFARELQEQAGLDLVLYLDGEFLATSFQAGQDLIQARVDTLPQEPGLRFSFNGDEYYHYRVEEAGSGLAQIFFYPASDIASQQGRLTRLAGGGILLVILLSSAIGVARARQISQPLERLRSAAEGLRMGDLATPVRARTEIREVKQVAQGLEGARQALQHSLEQLRREKAWVEHLLEAVVEGILTVDRGGCITFFSQGAERITGWKAEAVLGRSLDEVFQVVDEKVPFSQRIPAPGGLQKVPVYLAGGQEKTLSVTGARLAPPEAGRAQAVLVLRDVSDEEAIRRLLGEFLANISHEFRTPLTALGASIELLREQLSDLTQEELSELLGSTTRAFTGFLPFPRSALQTAV